MSGDSDFLLYTWKDVERYCFIHRDLWERELASIEVYPDEIILHRKNNSEKSCAEIMRTVFGEKYSPTRKAVILDLEQTPLSVIEEEEEPFATQSSLRPLFRSVLYQKSAYPAAPLEALKKPVIAFHSYKGGVGRTLSLTAFAKAWSSIFAKGGNPGLLIVDADIEAPGLTWIQGEDTPGFQLYPGNASDVFSYLDLLTLIQDSKDYARTIETACSKLKMS